MMTVNTKIVAVAARANLIFSQINKTNISQNKTPMIKISIFLSRIGDITDMMTRKNMEDAAPHSSVRKKFAIHLIRVYFFTRFPSFYVKAIGIKKKVLILKGSSLSVEFLTYVNCRPYGKRCCEGISRNIFCIIPFSSIILHDENCFSCLISKQFHSARPNGKISRQCFYGNRVERKLLRRIS